ncbi:hypothetical protein [Halobaculum sp. MBLA0143]|uniref:hypothetical protein n=1 Tax=Halobaculum sp. MBLA0143 TaxID=3079933 RepID=UPI003524D9DC
MISVQKVDCDNKEKKLSPSDWESFCELYEKMYKNTPDESVRKVVRSEVRAKGPKHEVFSAIKDAFIPSNNDTRPYEAAFTNPLHEVKNNKADLLVVSAKRYINLCFVFCKPNTDNYENWAIEINRVKNLFEENKNKIKKQLGHQSKSVAEVQYATVLPKEDIADIDLSPVVRAINVSNYSVWSVDDDYKPSDSTSAMTQVKIEDGKVGDSRLRSILNSGIDYRNAKNNDIVVSLFTSSRVVLKEILISIMYNNLSTGQEEPKEFDKAQFISEFVSLCEVGGSKGIKKEKLKDRAKEHLEKGVNLGVIADQDSKLKSNKSYRIMYQGDGPGPISDMINKKVVKSKIPMKKAEIAYDKARREFSPSDPGNPSLDDYK